MTEQERKYYEELKSNPKDWNFDNLFNINEKGEAIPKEGTWFRLMSDNLPMFFPTIQKRTDLLNDVTTSNFQNKSANTQTSSLKMASIFDDDEIDTPSNIGNSIFDFEKEAGIDSKMKNWYDEAIKRHDDAFGNKLLQINLVQVPKTFDDIIKFEITTTISIGEKITVTINDVDSILSNEPDKDVDTQLYSNQYTITIKNIFSIQLTEEMQEKAFSDVEYDVAECYIKVIHSKITDVYSNIFNVTKKENKKENKKNEECKKEKVPALELDDDQKKKFIATVLCETQLGNDVLFEIAWVYYNRVRIKGFDHKDGLKASSAFRHKQPDYKLCSYYFGIGQEYADVKYGNFTIKSYTETNEFKEKKEPKFIKLKKFIETNVFSKNPETCFKDWFGQGYWGDLDLNPDDPKNETQDPKWYQARQYYWLQLEKKVKKNYVHIMRTGIGTSFIFDEVNIAKFFKTNPKLLPEADKVKKFRNKEGLLNFDL
jgi:hypothetical protein